MKKGVKILLIVFATLLVIGAAAFIYADVLASRWVKRHVDTALSELPFGEASCGEIQVRLFSGTAGVKDIAFSYPPSLEVHIDEIELGRFFYSALLAHKLSVTNIRITRPIATIVYDSNHPDRFFPEIDDKGLDRAGDFLNSAELFWFRVDNACLSLRDVSNNMEITIDSIDLRLNDLSYSWQDSVFRYNDSVYSLTIDAFRFFDPKEPMLVEAHDIHTEDQSSLTTGSIHFKHAIDKRKLAARKHEPATWIDLKANHLKTSPINLFRKALAKDLSLDNVSVDIQSMDIFRDARIAPKKPFLMPQTVLLRQPVTLDVKHVDAKVHKLDIEFASTDVTKGEMHLKNIRACVEHANNHRGNTILVHGNCPIDNGRAEADMHITLNRACDWNVKLHVTDVNTNYLNSFTRPLIGITCDCHVDELTADYVGNSVKADGTFRMLYHGLNVKVHKDDKIPYKIITKNADSFTTFGNTLIPKSNPTAVDIRPRAYQVEWQRDEWKPFPLFLFGPCIDGVKKTMLPGLYVHKQVQEKK